MDLRINNYQTSFKAQMQVRGDLTLLKNEQIQTLKTIIDNVGSKTDIVDINLSKKTINKGFITVAVFAVQKLSQFLGEFKDNDVYTGIVNALEQTKEIFPTVAAIITSSLATEETRDVEKADEIITTTNKKQDNNLEIINTKIDEFIDYKKNLYWASDLEESFILMTIRNSIHNDKTLHDEYTMRMKQKTYFYFDSYSDDYRDINYTGDDVKDFRTKGSTWYLDSVETIYEMLQDDNLKEKIANSILKILSNNRTLDNFGIEQLENYYKKLNEKFDDYIKLANNEYSGKIFILKEHPITNCVPDDISNNNYLSKLAYNMDQQHFYQKDNETRRFLVVCDLLNDKIEFRSQLMAQLLLNHPCNLSIEKQKEILDKILQSTIRENTPEEIERIKNSSEVIAISSPKDISTLL